MHSDEQIWPLVNRSHMSKDEKLQHGGYGVRSTTQVPVLSQASTRTWAIDPTNQIVGFAIINKRAGVSDRDHVDVIKHRNHVSRTWMGQ